MKNFSETVHAKFTEKNWRVTAGIQSLTKTLEASRKPLSVRVLTRQLTTDGHRVDLATVYRQLGKLKKLRLIHQIDSGFMHCSQPENVKESHHFLICEKCGHAEEIFLDYQDSISEQLAKEKKFLLQRTKLIFFGTCGTCTTGRNESN